MTWLVVHSLPDVTNYRTSLREVSTQESQLAESSNQNKVLQTSGFSKNITLKTTTAILPVNMFAIFLILFRQSYPRLSILERLNVQFTTKYISSSQEKFMPSMTYF